MVIRFPRGIRRALERLALAFWFAGVCALLYLTLQAQLARAAEFPADVGAGTLLFRSSDGFDPAAPLSTDVRASIAGIVARVTVTQTFRNAGSEWAEAVYAFPLPDDAAVDGMQMRIGDRVIEGEIHERERAERVYAAAREAGQRTSLVRQSTPNLFTTAVANIAPGEAIDITIDYLQTARYDAGELSLRLPLTITPRYGAGAPEPDARPSSAAPSVDAPAAAAPVRSEASVRIVLAPGMPVAAVGAKSHEVSVLRPSPGDDADRYVIEPATRIPMDRDFVLVWRPEAGSEPRVAALTETLADTTYALLMIVPPSDVHALPAPPRETIYVIDTSGSMGGQSIEQAKLALKTALGRLTGADRFNVLQFNSWVSGLFPEPAALTAETHAQALRYVDALVSTGGTEMEPAIRAALAQPAADGYLRQVIFLTDGAVAGETALFTAIKQNLGDARLFTIGIGSAPNSHFMRKAAQFGRGTYTHIAKTDEIASAMTRLFEKIERVALTDVLVDWPDAVEIYPGAVPDLYAGEPVVVTASFAKRSEPLEVEVFGRIAGTQWSQRVTAPAESQQGIAKLWARRKIEYLTDSRVDSTDESLIAKLVVDVALEHHLVSPYTSLVAVDKTPARTAAAALERRALGNATPAGASFTTLPQTATQAPLLRWLGIALLLAAAAIGALETRRARGSRAAAIGDAR